MCQTCTSTRKHNTGGAQYVRASRTKTVRNAPVGVYTVHFPDGTEEEFRGGRSQELAAIRKAAKHAGTITYRDEKETE